MKNILIEMKYSVAQVAELIGTSQQNLASSLKHTDVRSGLIEKIAAAIGVPLSVFYGESFGTVQTATGNNNTQVAGNSNSVHTDGAFMELLKMKDEQLTMAMKQTSKAQEQMDRVLDMHCYPEVRREDAEV